MKDTQADDAPSAGAEPSPWDAAGLAQQEFPPGLYVVATPLGNAADVTLRALWVMRMADGIACEDTRTTAPLLARFGIRRPLLALHRHNETGASQRIVARLAGGERWALVSDAGTPAISDPGAPLVRACLDAGIRVLPVPGPSSLSAALSVAGAAPGAVHFAGFAPPGGEARARHWRRLAQLEGVVVIFEAPHRIGATAQELGAAFAPERRVVLARELTKKFESVAATRMAQLPQAVADSGERGEYVLVIDAPAAPPAAAAIDAVTARWLEALAPELPAARIAALAARASGLPRALLYDALAGRSGSPEGAGLPASAPAPRRAARLRPK